MNGPGAMLPAWLIILASLVYVSLLFGIAYYGDRRASRGHTLVANPWIYALSIAVYCTAWTFYGSVGRAASGGFEYLTIYIGPTLMFALGWVVLRKMIRISKVNRITSIADFISSRYGKSSPARRAGDDYRRDRHHAVHLPAAQSGRLQLYRAARLSGGRDGMRQPPAPSWLCWAILRCGSRR